MGERVQLKVQENAQGFGHAVLLAHEFVGDEPFLLILGDHLYRSSQADGISCTSQIIDVYDRHNDPVIALHQTPKDQVHRFGVITGTWCKTDCGSQAQTVLQISEIKEKPSLELAEATMKVEGIDDVRPSNASCQRPSHFPTRLAVQRSMKKLIHVFCVFMFIIVRPGVLHRFRDVCAGCLRVRLLEK